MNVMSFYNYFFFFSLKENMNNKYVNKIVSYYIYTVFFLITSNGVNFFLPLILMNDDIITVTRNGSILDEFLPLNLDWILLLLCKTIYYLNAYISFIFICEELSKQFEGTSLEDSEQQSKTGT